MLSSFTFLLLCALTTCAAQECPAGSATGCGPSQTCCPTFESLSGFGCCNHPNAVCCPRGPMNQNCCPEGYTCVSQGYGATCVPPSGPNVSGTHVCSPGAAQPPSTTLPSAITIGDSVSEGYQPVLSANLSAVAFIQHSPHSDGGGADDVMNGVACVENWLRTQDYKPAHFDLISFNFGLHDLDNSTANFIAYEEALTNFTLRLKLTASKLLFISTTPQMQVQWFGNNAPTELNAIAKRVVTAAGIPYADLYGWIVKRCGEKYYSCDICDQEPWPPSPPPPPGAHCGYHYNAIGYEYIVSYLAPIFKSLLTA